MPPLNPLLETDKIECIHKGKVLLQSSTKDLMCVQDSSGTDAGAISLQDLANAVIIGCTNNIAGIPNPCTKLVSIPNSITSSLLEIDNQKIVLAQAISQVITDKGSPLILQGEPKAKDILELDEDIVEFNNAQNDNDSEKSISESSPKSSNQSNAGSNESNAKSSKDSSDSQSMQDSQAQKEQMVLEVVRKWEYRGGGDTNADNWATISEFTLKKDNEILKDSQGKDIKGYIIEPAGINPHRMGKLSQNQQQTTSGSDTRIPAGEYKMFWKYVSKRTYLKTSFEFYKTLQNIEKQTNKKFLCNCSNVSASLAKIYPYHTHIVPELINVKGRSAILIHNGSGGGDSDGCLLPANQFRNQLFYDKREINNKTVTIVSITIGTNDFIHILMNELAKHDIETFKNYKHEQQIKNFLVRIKEEKIIIFDTDEKTNQFLSIKSKGHR